MIDTIRIANPSPIAIHVWRGAAIVERLEPYGVIELLKTIEEIKISSTNKKKPVIAIIETEDDLWAQKFLEPDVINADNKIDT
jgi:hypothetical protein